MQAQLAERAEIGSMSYVYSAMWFLAGLILIVRMGRENKIFYFAGAFFIVLGAWWLADELLPLNLFTGVWGLLLRIVTGVALLILCLAFFRERRALSQKEPPSAEKDGEDGK